MMSTRKDAKHVGPWRLGQCIGKGSSGRVYIATHTHTGQYAAVKRLPLERSMTHQDFNFSRLRLEREIAMLKMMNHPNIVHIFDVFETKRRLSIVLEYVGEGQLFELICRGLLPVAESQEIFRQVICGVNYAHVLSIIHRDLKLENILVACRNPITVKIADWGMAAFAPSFLMLETSCGSPHYASPEIIKGLKYQGKPTDIWSCGVILFALLTGKFPFMDENYSAMLDKVKAGIYKIPFFIDSTAQDLIQKMLTINPSNRITAAEILSHPWLCKHPLSGQTCPIPVQRLPPSPSILARPVLSPDFIEGDLFYSLRAIWGCHADYQGLSIVHDLCSPAGRGIHSKAFYFLLGKFRDEVFVSKLHEGQAKDDYLNMGCSTSTSSRHTSSVGSRSTPHRDVVRLQEDVSSKSDAGFSASPKLQLDFSTSASNGVNSRTFPSRSCPNRSFTWLEELVSSMLATEALSSTDLPHSNLASSNRASSNGSSNRLSTERRSTCREDLVLSKMESEKKSSVELQDGNSGSPFVCISSGGSSHMTGHGFTLQEDPVPPKTDSESANSNDFILRKNQQAAFSRMELGYPLCQVSSRDQYKGGRYILVPNMKTGGMDPDCDFSYNDGWVIIDSRACQSAPSGFGLNKIGNMCHRTNTGQYSLFGPTVKRRRVYSDILATPIPLHKGIKASKLTKTSSSDAPRPPADAAEESREGWFSLIFRRTLKCSHPKIQATLASRYGLSKTRSDVCNILLSLGVRLEGESHHGRLELGIRSIVCYWNAVNFPSSDNVALKPACFRVDFVPSSFQLTPSVQPSASSALLSTAVLGCSVIVLHEKGSLTTTAAICQKLTEIYNSRNALSPGLESL